MNALHPDASCNFAEFIKESVENDYVERRRAQNRIAQRNYRTSVSSYGFRLGMVEEESLLPTETSHLTSLTEHLAKMHKGRTVRSA